MARNSEPSTIHDFRNCCRLCFERDSKLENVFASRSESTLADKIASCLDVSISPEDSPATSICVRCLSSVNQFFDFKQLCKMHELTFQTSIRTRTKSSEEPVQQRPAEVYIKSEVLEEDDEDSIPLAQIKISSRSIKQEMDPINETPRKDSASSDAKKSTDDGKRKKRKYGQSAEDISVRLLHNGYLMKCNGIKLNGTMAWVCRNSACRMCISTGADWQITLHMTKVHNHYPYADRKGLIRCVNSGLEERFAVGTVTGKTVLLWDGCEWIVCEKTSKAGKTRANCKEHRAQCRKYLMITGDYTSLEHFGEHDHQRCYILFRDDDNPTESDQSPWSLFSQINPCRLPIGNDWDSNQRVKLFYKRYQYRLLDCSWSGDSRWLCDTVGCTVLATMNGQGNVQSAEHNHEPLASGLFNGLYYCVVRGNTRSLKLFFNGHCYGSRGTAHWVCTMTACYAKLFVGNGYETFAEKGVHNHGAYNAVVKPLHKETIHLTPESPYLPPTITINDLHEKTSSATAAITEPKPSKEVLEQSPNKVTKEIMQADEAESTTRCIRMIFDGFRYTLWEIYPDGTSYWRCWGMRCNKSMHMAPTGSIYFKNDSLEHQHEPQVSKVDQITHEDGQTERYAIFQDATLNTIMGYRNSLWHLVLGEASYIGTCKDQRCGASVKITENFSRFEHFGKCDHHGEKMLLIRVAAELVEGDINIWELFKQKHPLRVMDGTIYDGGRHSQMFFGGYRFTLVGLSWTGNALWRCALQKCPVRGRITQPNASFLTSSHIHNHEKQELFQGKIWSRARQQEERYFIIITLKKTTATMYYNTYCYSLKDQQRNVWICSHSQCSATLRVEGDFEWVVDEMVHAHSGTLTFVRDSAAAESQECYAPAPPSSRKRLLEEADDLSADMKPFKLPYLSTASTATSSQSGIPEDAGNSLADVKPLIGAVSSSSSNFSSKLETIINTLVKVAPKNDQDSQEQNTHYYHGGYTYNRATVQADKNTKLDCKRLRCPGRIILAPDQSVYPQDSHTHSKTFETIGHIQDVNGPYYLYVLVSGTQKRTVTYFVCDGFRYHVQTKAPDVGSDVVWQCVQCEVKATVNDSYSYISLSSPHDHEPCDIIIPSDEPNPDDNSIFQLDEIIWGQHRYNNPIYIRRFKQTKWKCYRLRDCRAYLYRSQDGCFKQMEHHTHEPPIEICGEATFDPMLQIKDRFAIMKHYGKTKFRHIVFQNQVYVFEGDSNCWNCVRYSCNAKLIADDMYQNFQLIGEHSHQPIIMVIKFEDEVLPFTR